MKLTVVGCSGTYPTQEAPCSAYLFSEEGYDLLVDLGPGTFVALQRYIDIHSLDAIVLTHFHPDHCVDIYPLYYALRFSDSFSKRVPLLVPEGTEQSLFAFLSGDSRQEFSRVFELQLVESGQKMGLGPFDMEFARTNHPVETLAIAVSDVSGTVAYSADTGPGGGFPELASKADLVICEATYQTTGQGPAIHLSSQEAGALAESSGAGQLVLTHRFPTCDRQAWLECAAAEYSGEMYEASPGLVIRL